MSKLVEAREELDATRQKLAKVFEQAGDDMDMDKVTEVTGTNAHEKVKAIRELNAQMEEKQKEVDGLVELEKSKANVDQLAVPKAGEHHQPGSAGTGDEAPYKTESGLWVSKSMGELFTESDAYLKRGQKETAALDIHPAAIYKEYATKTTFETGAGWAPETTRTGRVVDIATRPIQVVDIIPQTTTGQSAVVFMEETTFTNAAQETAEGGTYQEAALQLTEKSSQVRKIAVWLPMTDEQLEDVPQAQGYVNNRLPFMLRQRLDSQILTGDGIAPNLEGILNKSGILSQAKGTDPTPDAVYKGITKVQVTGQAMADTVVFHPNDWQSVRLLRTSDGIYIWGNPSEAGPSRIWGLPVAQAQAMTEGTALVGDFGNFVELAQRRGVEIQVTDSHAGFFIEGKQAIRADMRAALVVYRPAAFCEVTGL